MRVSLGDLMRVALGSRAKEVGSIGERLRRGGWQAVSVPAQPVSGRVQDYARPRTPLRQSPSLHANNLSRPCTQTGQQKIYAESRGVPRERVCAMGAGACKGSRGMSCREQGCAMGTEVCQKTSGGREASKSYKNEKLRGEPVVSHNERETSGEW